MHCLGAHYGNLDPSKHYFPKCGLVWVVKIGYRMIHHTIMLYAAWRWPISYLHINGLVQERRNSIANALELCLSCTNLSIWDLQCKDLGHCRKIVNVITNLLIKLGSPKLHFYPIITYANAMKWDTDSTIISKWIWNHQVIDPVC